MNLVLDFRDARETPCHCYTGVLARIGEGDARHITITPEGCHAGFVEGPTAPCERPVVDRTQAWSIAFLLTGSERASPSGEGLWDADARRMDFPMRSGGRRPITD